VSDAFWITSSNWWRWTATSKSGLTDFLSRVPSAIRLYSWATLKGRPAGTAGEPKLRNLPGHRRLAYLALTGDGRKATRLHHCTKTLSAPRRSIDFLEKRKDHSKEIGIIPLRQEAYVPFIAYRRCAQAFTEPGGAVATEPWKTAR
jgi:hypothetical protein